MTKQEQKLTPMMQQYCKLRQTVDDETLLLFRMGDFYELFFEDAKKAVKILGITLTKRGGVPMAGIPHHSLSNYLPKIAQHSLKVALAEQEEEIDQSKGGGLVKRAIKKIITPGTILDEQSLMSDKPNYILAICPNKNSGYGLSFLDLSTGKFYIMQISSDSELANEVCRLNPAEILYSNKLAQKWEEQEFKLDINTSVTLRDNHLFDEQSAIRGLQAHFKVKSLEGFGYTDQFSSAIIAANVVLQYIQKTLLRDMRHTTKFEIIQQKDYMILDRISQRNLEIAEPIFLNAGNSTLLSVLNQCVCPMGSRLMREWLLRPLICKQRIQRRLDAVEVFLKEQYSLGQLRELLGSVRDIERLLARISSGVANARELVALKNTLKCVPNIKALLKMFGNSILIKNIHNGLYEFGEVCHILTQALVDEPPLTIKDGGFIRKGYNGDLDQLRQGSLKGKQWLLEFEKREKERTGIKNLKVRFNKVFGYYIEISKGNLSRVPDNYIRKQTLVNNERFITEEIKTIEDKILGAEDKINALEYELFQDLRQRIVSLTKPIQETASKIAVLDVLSTFAHISLKYSYVRPEITTEDILDIKDGKHPVIDVMLEDNSFVANATNLDSDSYIHIITGPNMAGKSTYIRQVALLTIMSQVGCFIPCSSAIIGIRHSIFTRIGAADDLSRGQSTFMVEMIETANILNNADDKSLIILDEIGRGTSTFDGLSIAWAIVEYLAKSKAFTLFATHYHELTKLAANFRGIKNFNVAVREWNEQIIFLHRIIDGAADKSYGIYVARLAGLPQQVISRSKDVLSHLEGGGGHNQKHLRSDLVIKGREKSNQRELF